MSTLTIRQSLCRKTGEKKKEGVEIMDTFADLKHIVQFGSIFVVTAYICPCIYVS